MHLVFDAEDMNAGGICRGWVCDWIRRSKAGQAIASRHHLGSEHLVGALWDAADDNDGIDANFGLRPLETKANKRRPIDPQWIATELTKGTGHYVFAVRGRTLNTRRGRFDDSGHAMGTRKGYGRLQFFDPNEGLIEFDNTLEFYDFLPSYIRTTYPDLLTKEAEVKRF